MTGRNFGVLPSTLVQAPAGVDALDFDTAVTMRLMQYDNDRENDSRKWWATLLGAKTNDDDAVLDSPVLNDKYADKNTMYW